MNITRLEQETIVNFNAAEDTASVYTADPVYMRKLDKLCEREPVSYKLVKQDKDGKWYEMPKRLGAVCNHKNYDGRTERSGCGAYAQDASRW